MVSQQLLQPNLKRKLAGGASQSPAASPRIKTEHISVPARTSASSGTTGDLVMRGRGELLTPVQWVDLGVSPAEMRPSFTLATGQCFHWRQMADDLWVGVLGPYALAVRESASTTYFALLGSKTASAGNEQQNKDDPKQHLRETLHDYFQLSENFSDLFEMVRCVRIVKSVL